MKRTNRYLRGTDRNQTSLLSTDDLISSRNPIRLMDDVCEEYCENLPEGTLWAESEKGQKETGRKAYHPADLLKIMVYGYFNGLCSSRKLERESGRNIELRWLIHGIVPDHKTIADFRRHNGDLIEGLFSALIIRFKEEGLIKGKGVAIDGTKIKANASKSLDLKYLKEKLKDIENQTVEYLSFLQKIDDLEDRQDLMTGEVDALEKKIEELSQKKKRHEASVELLSANGQEKISPTDPDARRMQGRGGNRWGYNLQTAVDADSHLITAVRLTNAQNDKGQLLPLVEAHQQMIGEKPEEVYADAGYYKINDLDTLENDQGIDCYVAVNKNHAQKKDEENGLKFTYDTAHDIYICNEGKPLVKSRRKSVAGRRGIVYEGTECSVCSQRTICTKAQEGRGRTVHRNDNQEWIDTYHAKLESVEGKKRIKIRGAVAEHPFGTMKYSMGQIPLLLRGKNKVSIEVNLHAIAYNLKRYLSIQAQVEQYDPYKTRMAA